LFRSKKGQIDLSGFPLPHTIPGTSCLARVLSNRYNTVMERVFNKFSDYAEAEQHDIEYYIHLSVCERRAIAALLKKRVYGENVPDIREYHKHR
ncbi:MAG: hypothetical protein JXB06_15415, partial [Spirochaetales bacterium]|nr:hypothetical protein [Spirochaetales bacterium]